MASEEILPDYKGKERSQLLKLLYEGGARPVLATEPPDLGLEEHIPFPFLAMVGQEEMRTALILSVINPAIGGVLLIGPRGVGKTVAVRSLRTLLPDNLVSDCPEGEDCLPEDIGPDGDLSKLCPSCAARVQEGKSIAHYEPVKLIELPLNARVEDVVGGINERVAVQQQRVRIERGILARADQNLLYVDEVNLLDDQIVDAILDAAAQGSYTVRRGAITGTYRARFIFIGSMNPEEGGLRPQIMDRFGLRVTVRGLTDPAARLEVYRRVQRYKQSRARFAAEWYEVTEAAREEVSLARELLKTVTLTQPAIDMGLELIRSLGIDSHRTEIAMFEAARAHAAADGRDRATVDDVRAVAVMSLRQRRSEFMLQFLDAQDREDAAIAATMAAFPAPKEAGS
ncbi:MAG: ATP-binding protein [Anaerolineae bacterium]|nr:ATP-binding protein [Anaerolineae bacterium]